MMSPKPSDEKDFEGTVASSSDTLVLTEVVGFFYRYRRKLLLRTLLLVVIFSAVFLAWYFLIGKSVKGTIALRFQGIEKHEYPSGRKFSVEDFRSPTLVGAALERAGLANTGISVNDFTAYIYLTPIIPTEIRNRWKKQDETGAVREEYYPSEFELEIAARGLSDNQRIRLFDAIVRGYQARIQYEQKAALDFVAIPGRISYQSLAEQYDYWDIPSIFRMTYDALVTQLKALIKESRQLNDSTYHFAFRDVQRRLENWFNTRLLSLEGLTYEGLLVKDRDMMTRRIQHQIQDLEILVRQRRKESEEAVRLLETLERPKSVLAGQLVGKDSIPLVDVNALDRLVKNDYVAPVVVRISTLQEEIQSLEVQRERLQNQMAFLPKARNLNIQSLPESYRAFVTQVSSELAGIVQTYNQLLDDYLAASVLSSVYVTRPPIVTRRGFSTPMLVITLLILCVLLAPLTVLTEVLLEKARASSG